MNLFCIADIHISEKLGLSGGNPKIDTPDGPRRRSLVEQDRCLAWLAEQAAAEEPDAILFAGDLYDRHNPTPNEESVALAGMRRLADIAPTYVLLGNHTQSKGDDESALASLRAMQHPEIEIIETPRTISLGEATLYCLPYPPLGRVVAPEGESWGPEVKNGKVSQGLADIVAHWSNEAQESDEPSILFSHVTWAGGEYNPGRPAPMEDVRVPTDRLPVFDGVVAGHLHMRQRIGGLDHARYVGPPDRWSFNDEGNPAGYGVFSTGSGWRFEPYEAAREFTTTTPDEFLEWAAHNGSAPDWACGQTWWRVRGEVADMEAIDAVEQARDEFAGRFGAITLDVSVPEDDRELSEVDPDAGLEGLFGQFMEDRPDAVHDELRDSVFEAVEQVAGEVEGA